MQKFEYRNPRIRTDLSVTLATGEQRMSGRCTDISVEGIGATLLQPLAVGTSGALTLESDTNAIELQARVTYSEQNRVGIVFSFACDEERNSLMRFLQTVPKLAKS